MSDNPKIHFDLPTGVQATDLTQVFTSKPYPVIVIDAMTVRGDLAKFLLNSAFVDASQPAGALESFERKTFVFTTQAVGPEATAASGDLLDMELKDGTVVTKTFTADTEATAPSATLDGMKLNQNTVVSTTVEPDAMQSTGDLVGLALE